MTDVDAADNLELSRRKLLAAASVASGALAANALTGIGNARAAVSDKSADAAASPAVSGLHLQFGADASSDVTVSWHTLQPVGNPRVVLGRPDGRLEQTVAAMQTTYMDEKSKRAVYAYHTKISRLKPELGLHVRRDA